MRVLVCGSRDWSNVEIIAEHLRSLPSGTALIHGGCKGADLIAALIGAELGFEVVPFPADWGTHGKAAGPIRNQRMLDEGKPDLIIAFHNDISSSRGTADMLRRAERCGVQIKIVAEE